MKRLAFALVALASPALASPALAAEADPHAGHDMSHMAMPTPADPHAGHVMPAAPAPDPHAGHDMSHMAMPAPTDSHAGHDLSAMPAAPAAEDARTGADLPVGNAAAPPPPSDLLAARVYDPAAMARAHEAMAGEHGRVRVMTTMVDRLEWRPDKGADGYGWRGEFRSGGDVDRLSLKTEGDGARKLERAEAQALWSHAIGPYFDLQAGARQDFGLHPRRTYAVVGVQGLAPYWFEVAAHAFVSEKGDLSTRFEADYDLRLTQRLILQPSGELTVAASSDPAAGVGSGVSTGEFGLRLRYEVRREFAPYLGVHYEKRFGRTADLARAAGEDSGGARFVVGVRTWF